MGSGGGRGGSFVPTGKAAPNLFQMSSQREGDFAFGGTFNFDDDERPSEVFQDENMYRTDSVFLQNKEELLDTPSSNTRGDKEYRKFETYENQRVWMGIFTEVLFPHERSSWSDKDGKVKLPKNSILLPIDGEWSWETEWEV